MRPRTPPPDRRPRRVLLADAARARLFERDPDTGALRELLDDVHPASRLNAAARGHDRPGRGARGEQRVVFAPTDEAARRELQHFADEIARQLEAAGGGRPLPWALLASSPFLGRLRQALAPAVAAALVLHRDLDLTALPLHALEPRLRELIPPGPPPGSE